MYRALSLLIMTALLFALAGCGEKKTPDPAAIQGKNILSTLKAMSKSYEQKDLKSFMSDVTNRYPDREEFSKSLVAVFDKYQTIHFTIQYAKMLVTVKEKKQIKVAFNWDAEWINTKGLAQKNGGRVTLVLDAGSFKLIGMDGKNPFIPIEGQANVKR
jgi:hypothetical protein